jgi:hypothetical protein
VDGFTNPTIVLYIELAMNTLGSLSPIRVSTRQIASDFVSLTLGCQLLTAWHNFS